MAKTNKALDAPPSDQDLITAAAAARMMKLKSSEAVAYHVKRKHLESVPHRHKDGTLGFRLRAGDVRAFMARSAANVQPRLFTPEEAARILGLKAPQVVRLAKAGRLQSAQHTPVLGVRGRPGLRFTQEHLDAFRASATDPATTMTVPEVCRALDLLGEDQVLHLATTRGWFHLQFEGKGAPRLYVQRADVEAFKASGDRTLANLLTLEQAASVIGYAAASVFRLLGKDALRCVRDHGRIWIDADDARAMAERVKDLPHRPKRSGAPRAVQVAA